ncbi:MAG: hypothetical protein WCK37_01795 [Candidatus Falkowbacteria bacterium]
MVTISIFKKNGKFIFVDSENGEEIIRTKMPALISYLVENFETEYNEVGDQLFNFSRKHESLNKPLEKSNQEKDKNNKNKNNDRIKITLAYNELDGYEQLELISEFKAALSLANGLGIEIPEDFEAEY